MIKHTTAIIVAIIRINNNNITIVSPIITTDTATSTTSSPCIYLPLHRDEQERRLSSTGPPQEFLTYRYLFGLFDLPTQVWKEGINILLIYLFGLFDLPT
jgi:hypothetical protein